MSYLPYPSTNSARPEPGGVALFPTLLGLSHYAAQVGLKLSVLLPQAPEC